MNVHGSISHNSKMWTLRVWRVDLLSAAAKQEDLGGRVIHWPSYFCLGPNHLTKEAVKVNLNQ